MNRGLSLTLKSGFTDVVAIDRPLGLDKKIPNPNWLAGIVNFFFYFFIYFYILQLYNV